MKTLISLLLLSLLGACASVSDKDINQRLASWRWHHIDELVRIWGVPTKKQQIQGKRYAEWFQSKRLSSSGFSIGGGRSSGGSFGGAGISMGGNNKESKCRIQAQYNKKGIVTRLTWKGEPRVCDDVVPTYVKRKR